MNNLLDALHWRYATKKFDPSKKLTAAQLDTIVEAGRLSASSYGLQPYVIAIIENPAMREQLKAQAWNQSQVTDASHLLVLCARTNLGPVYVDHYVDLIAKERGVTAASLEGYRNMMAASVEARSAADLTVWAQKQAYIALGSMLTACAVEGIDACPMEGFDPAKFDEILGLHAKHLTATLVCPIGYRASDDAHAAYKKVRFPKEEFVIEVK